MNCKTRMDFCFVVIFDFMEGGTIIGIEPLLSQHLLTRLRAFSFISPAALLRIAL